MKIGVIYCGYGTNEYIKDSLGPWINARATKLGGHEYMICAVSLCFKGFDGADDGTQSMLRSYLGDGSIDWLITGPNGQPETAARGEALRWLVDNGADVIWQADSDEFYELDQIDRIARFVEANPWVVWFRLSLRNTVFTKDQYLVEPFTPPRIHQVKHGYLVSESFWDDNNVLYRGWPRRSWPDWNEIIELDKYPSKDTSFASMTVPQSVAWIRHETWLSNERSKSKLSYQRARGWTCSFTWDDTNNRLIFNEAYYKARGEPLPEVATESG